MVYIQSKDQMNALYDVHTRYGDVDSKAMPCSAQANPSSAIPPSQPPLEQAKQTKDKIRDIRMLVKM